jgi:hypothetical protein
MVEEEPQGGAYVIVHNVFVGDQYEPSKSWAGFLITFQYPRADVYPLFFDAALRRKDGRAFGEGFSQLTWRGRPALQVSRRSNRWNPATDTAAVKLAKVLDWMRSR